MRAAAVALLGVGWAREGFLSWFGSYLEQLSAIEPGSTDFTLMTTAMSLAGCFGSLIGGYVSDRYCRSKRGPAVLAYCACQLVCLLALHVAEGHTVASLVIVPLLAAFLFGALTLLMGAASADFVEPRLSGMASGILNAGQYIGAGAATVITGSVVGAVGWSAMPAVVAAGPLLACTATSVLIWLQKKET